MKAVKEEGETGEPPSEPSSDTDKETHTGEESSDSETGHKHTGEKATSSHQGPNGVHPRVRYGGNRGCAKSSQKI